MHDSAIQWVKLLYSNYSLSCLYYGHLGQEKATQRVLVLVSFPDALIKYPQQEQHEGEKVYFGQQFKGITHRDGKQGLQKLKAAAPTPSAVRKQRVKNARCCSAPLSIPHCPGSQPGNGATHSGHFFPPQHN